MKRTCPDCGYQSQFRVPCPVCRESRRQAKPGRPKQTAEQVAARKSAYYWANVVHKRGPRKAKA